MKTWLTVGSRRMLRQSIRRRGTGRSRPVFLELLESRQLLATLTVNSPLDNLIANDSLVTLREAIIAANRDSSTDLGASGSGADTIVFAESLNGQPIILSIAGSDDDASIDGDLDITGKVTIQGNGETATVIDAGGADGLGERVLHVLDGGNLTIDGLTISGGHAMGLPSSDRGAGIHIERDGVLSISGVTLSGNRAKGPGGGIWNDGAVTVMESTLSGNTSNGNGGGLASNGTMTVNESTLSGNSAFARGGGLYNNGTVTLTRSTVSGNMAGYGGGLLNGNKATVTRSTLSANSAIYGGGILNEGVATVTGSVLSGNTAESDGGGLYNDGTATVIDTTFSGNTANYGGGIRNNYVAAVIRSTLTGNSANYGGGLYNFGTATITGSTLSGNAADYDGGAIKNNDRTLTVSGSTIVGNASDADGDGNGIGGGIWTFDDRRTFSVLVNTIVAGNITGIQAAPSDVAEKTLESDSVNNLIGDPASAGGLVEGVDGNVVGNGKGGLLELSQIVAPLANNGGSTRTHKPLPGSRAIDAGSDAHATVDGTTGGTPLATDQRNADFHRIQLERVDIGALEVQSRLLDFGDAPLATDTGFASDYPVTLAQDGARHGASDLFFGRLVDVESDGQPDDQAGRNGVGGDDGIGDADEDGVSLIATMVANVGTPTTASFAVIASDAAFEGSTGKLDAWIDFDQSGSWEASEQVFSSVNVASGTSFLNFSVPANAAIGDTGARFRLSRDGGLLPTGATLDGEVEDYIVTVVDGAPAARAAILIEPTVTSSIEVLAEGGRLVVRRGATELFGAPADGLASLEILGTTGADAIHLSNLAGVFPGPIFGNAGSGDDRMTLVGAAHDLDLTQFDGQAIEGIDWIDITGSGSNRLALSERNVANLPDAGETLKVLVDVDDALVLADGQFEISSSIAEDEQFFVVAKSASDARLHIGGLNWTNPLSRLDVNNSGSVESIDALQILNQLNRKEFVTPGTTELVDPVALQAPFPLRFYDTSADGNLTPIDALRVINGVARGGSRELPESEVNGYSLGPKTRHADGDRDERVYDNLILLVEATNVGTHPQGSSVVASPIANALGTEKRTQSDGDAGRMPADQALMEYLLELRLLRKLH